MTSPRLTCPSCSLDLAANASGTVTAHRCPRCRGLWLDPASFQSLCAEDSRPPGEETALARPRPSAPGRPAARAEKPVRYRRCPACGDVMSRSSFARVSGVVIDVCRPHGAWLDRGDLGAIRRFLRDGGPQRHARARSLDAEARRPAPAGAVPPRDLEDLVDVLAGGGGWDAPARRGWLAPLAVGLSALGVWLLWLELREGSSPGVPGVGTLGVGLTCLWLAWRAFRRWTE